MEPVNVESAETSRIDMGEVATFSTPAGAGEDARKTEQEQQNLSELHESPARIVPKIGTDNPR